MSKHFKVHRISRFNYSGKNPIRIEKLGTCIVFKRTEGVQGRRILHCHGFVWIGRFDTPTHDLVCSHPNPKDKGIPKTTTQKIVVSSLQWFEWMMRCRWFRRNGDMRKL